MNWDEIGVIAEVIGAIAVVVSLVYVAVQIRQNSSSLNRSNEYAQATSVHESNSLYIQVFSPILENGDVADIYNRAMNGADLSETDSLRFAMFANTYLAYVEALYTQHLIGLGFAEAGEPEWVFDVVGPYLKKILTVPAARAWWVASAPDLFSPIFVSAISDLIDARKMES
jgi:hypothetical protein